MAYDNNLLLCGVDEHGWRFASRPDHEPEGLAELLSDYQDRLQALLDRPVLLHMFWNDGDKEVTVAVVAADRPANEKFKTFTLPFQSHKH